MFLCLIPLDSKVSCVARSGKNTFGSFPAEYHLKATEASQENFG